MSFFLSTLFETLYVGLCRLYLCVIPPALTQPILYSYICLNFIHVLSRCVALLFFLGRLNAFPLVCFSPLNFILLPFQMWQYHSWALVSRPMPPALAFQHLSPVPEHYGTGLGPLITVPDWYRLQASNLPSCIIYEDRGQKLRKLYIINVNVFVHANWGWKIHSIQYQYPGKAGWPIPPLMRSSPWTLTPQTRTSAAPCINR